MPRPATAPPDLEIPAVLNVVNVRYRDRDHRYPAIIGRPPRPKHDAVPFLAIIAMLIVLGAWLGLINCLASGGN